MDADNSFRLFQGINSSINCWPLLLLRTTIQPQRRNSNAKYLFPWLLLRVACVTQDSVVCVRGVIFACFRCQRCTLGYFPSVPAKTLVTKGNNELLGRTQVLPPHRDQLGSWRLKRSLVLQVFLQPLFHLVCLWNNAFICEYLWGCVCAEIKGFSA